MADSKGVAGEVEGDYSVVKVQLAGNTAGEQIHRPTKGTQVVWGGVDPGSPFGHLLSLIDKSGGGVNYTYVHAADLMLAPATVKDDGTEESEEKETEQQQPQEEHKDPEPPATHNAATTPSAGGMEGHGPLFEKYIEFDYKGAPARIWAHPHCYMSGEKPLVVYLHGINGKVPWDKLVPEKCPPLGDKRQHLGKLAAALIDAGKVTPLIIAAPTEYSNTPWMKFDLKDFVAQVEAQLGDQGVKIDEEEVSVFGHSGAGGNSICGLDRVAHAGGKLGDHKLKSICFADTGMLADGIGAVAKALKDNDRTSVLTMFKQNGGWPKYDSQAAYAKALGASGSYKLEGDESSEIDNALGDEKRAFLHVKVEALGKRHKEWQASGAMIEATGSHWDMVLMLSSYALPRFYPAKEEDKSAGLVAHTAVPPPVEEPKPVVTGGDWANVPPPPPVWDKAPAVDPIATGDAVFADPSSGIYWPVRQTKVHEGRAVSYIGSDNKSYGFGSAHGRQFLADRQAGVKNPDRFHVGIDVYANFHDIIVACEAGTVIQCEPFYLGVWKILVQHKSGVVINYGEVDKDSIKKYGIKKGMEVLGGQPLAEAGRMSQSSMLHFEMYPQGTKETLPFYKDKRKGSGTLKYYLNPTQYLLALAKNGK